MTTDRIEKTILLNVPLEKVWQAISTAEQFGLWFGAEFNGAFIAGKKLTAKIKPTTVDADIAKLQEPYAGKSFEWRTERIEPMQKIVFRWRPFVIEPEVDYSKEPMTEIIFELQESTDGISLTISESGFDKIPLTRRARAFAANEAGWEMQTQLIKKYLAHGQCQIWHTVL